MDVQIGREAGCSRIAGVSCVGRSSWTRDAALSLRQLRHSEWLPVDGYLAPNQITSLTAEFWATLTTATQPAITLDGRREMGLENQRLSTR